MLNQNGKPKGTKYTILFLLLILAVPAFLNASSESSSATLYMRQEVWDKAVMYWEKHLKKNPDDAEAHKGAGICYGRLDDYPKAYEHFAAAMRLKPSLQKEIDEYRIDFLRNKAINEGTTTYQSAEKATDKAQKEKLYQDAIKSFEKALIIAPEWGEGYGMIGQIYSKLGQQDKAIELYDKAYQNNKENLVVLANIAAIYKTNKKLDKAKEIYSMLIEETKPEKLAKNPNKLVQQHAAKIKFDALSGMASIYMAENKTTEAMQIYETLIKENPTSSTLYYNIGLAYYDAEQWLKADEAFEKSAEFEKDKVWKGKALWKAGMAITKAKEWAKAITVWLKYLELYPEDGNAHANIAVCYFNTQDKAKYEEHKKLSEKYSSENK